MKRFILYFLLITSVLSLKASKVVIYVNNGSWGSVKMHIIEDHFTKRKSVFGLQKLDAEHKTIFEMQLDRASEFLVEIGRYNFSLIVLPDQEYEVFVYPYEQRMEIVNDDSYNTNELIHELNQDIKEYGANNLTTDFAFNSDDLENLEDFIEDVSRKYRKTGGQYFRLYKDYVLERYRADFAKKTNNSETIDTMLDSVLLRDKIRYDLGPQIDFIKYWHYVQFYGYDYEFGGDEYQSLKDKAREINHPELRQLMELNAIETAFKGNFVNIHLVGDDLDSMLNVCLNDEIEIMAYNLKQLYYKFAKGDPVPNLSLKDQYGTLFNIEDYKGQVVFIGFFTMWSRSSVEDLKQIAIIKDHFKDDVKFVSVLVDNNMVTLRRFLEKNDYRWTFLNTGINSSIKEDFQLDQFPKYMIIGPNLTIMDPFAERPSEETLRELEMILKD